MRRSSRISRFLERDLLLSGCALFAIGMAFPFPAAAADVKVTASIAEAGVWDTNPLMRVDGVEEIYGSTTTPKLELVRQTPESELSLTTWLDHNIFDQDEFNSTDFHGKTRLATQTQRLVVALDAAADYDTTRTSEVSNLDSSIVASRHLGYNFAPSVKYSLSPISSVGLSGKYQKSEYEAADKTDYHVYSLSPSYQRNITERYIGVISANMRRYETDGDTDHVVDSIGPSIGVIANINENWSGNLYVGEEARREEVNGSVTQDWKLSNVFSGGLTFKGEQDEVRMVATRAQQSYSNGTDYLLTTFRLNAARRINQLFSVNLEGSYQFGDAQQSTDNRLDSLYSGQAGLTYHMTESLGVSTSYSYKHETFTVRDGAAERNVVRVGLTYSPRFEDLW